MYNIIDHFARKSNTVFTLLLLRYAETAVIHGTSLKIGNRLHNERPKQNIHNQVSIRFDKLKLGNVEQNCFFKYLRQTLFHAVALLSGCNYVVTMVRDGFVIQ